MPITHIHAITQTVSKALDYAGKDKVEKELKDDIKDSINYARNDKTGEVVYKTFTTTLNCPSGDLDVAGDFHELIDKYNNIDNPHRNRYNYDDKKNPLAWHLVQSFDTDIPPQLANQIGRELAQELLGDKFRIQISTHTNTENIHNHIIFCAWDEDGKKYNACNDMYRKIREISDRISESYGIQVLENTRKVKLVKWTDKDGKIHFYEPTDRKNNLIEKRKNGEISKDDISSYRNSESYEDFIRNAKSVREIVKHDIDQFLPFAMNYEHLLSLLREHLGYEISDKKKNGDWKEHTTFCPPTAEKGVRDYTLDKDGFYTRENLEKYIKENVLENENSEKDFGDKGNVNHGEKEAEGNEREIPVFENYTYSKIDVKKLDENKRAVRNPDNGEIVYRRRGEAEKTAIVDIKRRDKDLYSALYSVGFNSNTVDEIIKRQQEQASLSKWQLKKEQEKRVQESIEKIQSRLNVLQFMENNSLHTYNQLNTIIQGMWEKYNQSFSKVNEAETAIYQLEGLLKIEGRLKAVQERMENNRINADYIENELAVDKKTEQKYLYMIDKYKLNDPQEVERLTANIAKAKETAERLRTVMENYKKNLSMYENCVSVLRECDVSNEKAFAEVWSEYDRIQNAGRDGEKDNENNRRKREVLSR